MNHKFSLGILGFLLVLLLAACTVAPAEQLAVTTETVRTEEAATSQTPLEVRESTQSVGLRILMNRGQEHCMQVNTHDGKTWGCTEINLNAPTCNHEGSEHEVTSGITLETICSNGIVTQINVSTIENEQFTLEIR